MNKIPMSRIEQKTSKIDFVALSTSNLLIFNHIDLHFEVINMEKVKFNRKHQTRKYLSQQVFFVCFKMRSQTGIDIMGLNVEFIAFRRC